MSEIKSANATNPRLARLPSRAGESAPLRHVPCRSKIRAPLVPVAKAADWIVDYQNGNISDFPFDGVYTKDLKGRDHYILVDDSGSMREHWQGVGEVIRALAGIILHCKVDQKINIQTVIKDARTSVKRSREVHDFLDSHKPPEVELGQRVSSKAGKLENIFQDCQRTINGSIPRRGWRKFRHRPGHRPITLYVLTDGLQQENEDVETSIKRLTKALHKQFRENRYFIGIQFIRFGNDELGARQLIALDELRNNTSEVEWDLVDHEPADGSVLKMLNGSINPWFNNQDEYTGEQGTSIPPVLAPRPLT